jgi:hypothetical protein
MVKVDEDTIINIRKIVKRHVPNIPHHPILHIDTRKQMEKVIIYLIEKEQINPTLLTLNALASDWNNVLHLRANSLN